MRIVSKFFLVKCVLLLGFATAFFVASVKADMFMTYASQAGVETSSVANSSMFTFDSLPVNQVDSGVLLPISSSVTGTINKVYIDAHSSDMQYGGAADASYPNGASPFPVESNGGGSEGKNVASTITFNTPINYVGMWWSAGDPHNYLSFYNGSTLLGSFDTAWLASEVSSAYYGNPNPSNLNQDSGEPFAFINFFDTGGLGITSMVLSNPGSSGFESDNWTFRQAVYGSDPLDGPTLPGIAVEQVNGSTIVGQFNSDTQFTDSGTPQTIPPTSVPEPSVLPLVGLGVVGMLTWRWIRRKALKTVT